MPTRVQFPAAIEPLVQFIEETDPSVIVDQTLAKLLFPRSRRSSRSISSSHGRSASSAAPMRLWPSDA
jgi:hypothetical protein